MSGWIKLYRKTLKSDMYKSLNSKQRDVMMTLLMMVNHKENKWEWNGQIFKTKPGQVVTSIAKIKENCASDVSLQSVRTALLKLEKWGFLTNESTKTGRLITIVNWGVYQDGEDQTNKENNKELTKHQQRTNKELTTNKNDKNVKNDKEDIYSVFEHWNSKGIIKHRSLTDARKSKINARLKEISTDEIKQAIDNYSDILASDFHYWTHKWTLEEFMNPRNIERFMSENNPFENFRNTRKERKKEADRSNPVANGYYFDWSKEVERLENANQGS